MSPLSIAYCGDEKTVNADTIKEHVLEHMHTDKITEIVGGHVLVFRHSLFVSSSYLTR